MRKNSVPSGCVYKRHKIDSIEKITLILEKMKKKIPWHCGNPKNFLAHVLHLTPSKPGLQEHFPASSHLPSNNPSPSHLQSIKDKKEIEKRKKILYLVKIEYFDTVEIQKIHWHMFYTWLHQSQSCKNIFQHHHICHLMIHLHHNYTL